MKNVFRVFLITFVFLSYIHTVYADTQIIPTNGQNGAVLTGINDNGSSGTTSFGNSVGSHPTKLGFKYIPVDSHYVCQIDTDIVRTGTTIDNVHLDIYQGGSNMDNGTLLLSGAKEIVGSTIATSSSIVSFFFLGSNPPGGCFPVVKNTTYWFTFSRTGSPASNYYSFTYTDQVPIPTSDSALGWSKEFGAIGGSVKYPYVNLYGVTDGTAIDKSILLNQSNICGSTFYTDFCNTFVNLISPSQVDTTQIATFSAILTSKAPFAYINSALAINLASTSAATASPNFAIPINVQYQSHTLLNTSFTFNTATSSIISNLTGSIRGIFVILIWLSFIFYIFVTVRHII